MVRILTTCSTLSESAREPLQLILRATQGVCLYSLRECCCCKEAVDKDELESGEAKAGVDEEKGTANALGGDDGWEMASADKGGRTGGGGGGACGAVGGTNVVGLKRDGGEGTGIIGGIAKRGHWPGIPAGKA